MAVQGFQSTKAIISKVFRDLRIQDAHWVSDALEWCGEALEGIGSITRLEDKVSIVKTTSHKARIPVGLYTLEEIRYGYYNSELGEDNPPKLEDFGRIMPYEGSSLHPSLIQSYNSRKGASQYSNESFFIRGKFIQTSFEEDWIAIVYRAIATDCDGFPLVPNHFSFSQALYWYIVMKLLEGGMKHPAGDNVINWLVAEERWLKYCSQARTKALMPDPSKYREFARSWVSLIPNFDEEVLNRSFLDEETPEKLAGMAYKPIKEEN